MATLANAWARDGVDVTLITLANCSRDVYSLERMIDRIDLDLAEPSPNISRALIRNITRIRRLRAAIASCKPDAVISFMTTTNLLTLLASCRLGCPVLVSERIFIRKHPPRGAWRLLYRPLYRLAAEVVSQTNRGAADLEARLRRQVSVIPNPLMPARLNSVRKQGSAKMPPALRNQNARYLLAAGRLTSQKGFDLLIAAFSRITLHHPTWHLVIAGEGSERSALTTQVAELGLADRIHLLGFCNDPQVLMQQADLFVLSSRYEGMPNALLEAMAAGCPCISFDCETGPAELIEHGVNGWLVPPADDAALAAALKRLMADAGLRERLGIAAKVSTGRFTVGTVIMQWNALIAAAINQEQLR
jgi:glycosyltransferase involved in cell wall biosynthesis